MEGTECAHVRFAARRRCWGEAAGRWALHTHLQPRALRDDDRAFEIARVQRVGAGAEIAEEEPAEPIRVGPALAEVRAEQEVDPARSIVGAAFETHALADDGPPRVVEQHTVHDVARPQLHVGDDDAATVTGSRNRDGARLVQIASHEDHRP